MPVLTSSATFTIGAAVPATEELTLTVLPPAAPVDGQGQGQGGRGRLVHPSLGVIDYERAPDQWSGIDLDVLQPPVWASTKTLSSTAHTLWRGRVSDAAVVERWSAEGGLAMPMTQLRLLMALWQNPPDPANGYLQWWPSYTSALGFDVVLTGLTVGSGDGVTLDHLTKQGWVSAPVSLSLRVVGRR